MVNTYLCAGPYINSSLQPRRRCVGRAEGRFQRSVPLNSVSNYYTYNAILCAPRAVAAVPRKTRPVTAWVGGHSGELNHGGGALFPA